MSHSKKTKRGKSLFIEKWNPSAKRFINTCALCGKQGYDPSIDEEGFVHPAPDVTDHEHGAIAAELSRVYEPLALDENGHCEVCARILADKQ